VLKDVPSARLAIVGPDNEGLAADVRRWCREQGIENRVIFVEHLPQTEVREAYVDADVFVLPSYTENFGMTVAEAMACRCPVVISDQVNIWREVAQSGAGHVVRLRVEEISSAILAVLSDPGKAIAMGAAGRQLVQERFTWDTITNRLTRVYEAVQSGTELEPTRSQPS
jgi:glycosyltransferase involved in cell wall biosynthesis